MRKQFSSSSSHDPLKEITLNKLDWSITNSGLGTSTSSLPIEKHCTLYLNQFEELIERKAPLTINHATLQIRNIHKPEVVTEYDVIRLLLLLLDTVCRLLDVSYLQSNTD